MYRELFGAWQREIENPDLQPLPSDFYAKISEYLKRINEGTATLDKTTLKGRLLAREQRNVNRIIKELLKLRYKKLVVTFRGGQKIPPNLLTVEESEMSAKLLSFTETYRAFAKNILQGQKARTADDATHKKAMLRFLKEIPAIIGSDMKTYGPFAAEDVGSLPIENAKILVKQGFAEPIEVS